MRHKESKSVGKINPPNVILNPDKKDDYEEISYKCDTEHCGSKAEIFINAKFCKLCAQDHRF